MRPGSTRPPPHRAPGTCALARPVLPPPSHHRYIFEEKEQRVKGQKDKASRRGERARAGAGGAGGRARPPHCCAFCPCSRPIPAAR